MIASKEQYKERNQQNRRHLSVETITTHNRIAAVLFVFFFFFPSPISTTSIELLYWEYRVSFHLPQ